MPESIQLVPVQSTQSEALKNYIVALYEDAGDVDSIKNIEEGVNSLLKSQSLAEAYFVKQGETRIGYTILTKYYSVEKGGLTMYIDELYVEEKHRRRKIGSAILERVLAIAKNEGVKTLWAQTESHNQGAQDFFTGHGFVKNTSLNFERQM